MTAVAAPLADGSDQPLPHWTDLGVAARACLDAAAPAAKLALTAAAAQRWRDGVLAVPDAVDAPLAACVSGRPARPRLVEPRALSQRGLGTPAGRAAFIHAIAHIEFNAIDLAWDAVYRFRGMPAAFYADWVQVADDEARHFELLQRRLATYGHAYGDFDAHNGLWEMAQLTAHSGLERMALVPRVLEARGLDVTPPMITKLRHAGDDATADVLEVILREEVAHVAAGSRWFRWCCAQQGLQPEPTFADLVRLRLQGAVRGPFNYSARGAAGFSAAELQMLTELTELRA